MLATFGGRSAQPCQRDPGRINQWSNYFLVATRRIRLSEEGSKGQKNMNDGIGHKPLRDSYDEEDDDVTDELRVKVKK